MCGGSTKPPTYGGITLAVTVLVLGVTGAGTVVARAHSSEAGRTARTEVGSSTQEPPGRATFRQYCVPCHGSKGEGNGPAAVAFNPRPANFTDPDGLAKLTDEQVVEVITKGRGSMPAWGPILKKEQLGPLVAYLRLLSHGQG